MKRIQAEGSRRTPTMDFDPEGGIIKITGRSIPEDTFKFYQPYIDWVREYLEETKNKTTKLHIMLEYCNSSSSKYLLDILLNLDKLAGKKKEVILEWHYADNDEDMKEIGEDLASFLQHTKFEMLAYKREHPIF